MTSRSVCATSDFKIQVPPGQIVASSNWINTQLISHLRKDNRVSFLEDLGNDFDFFPSNVLAIIYINEADLLSDISACKRRVVRSRKVAGTLFRTIVIAQKTLLTAEMYREFQRFCGIEIGVTIIPVSVDEEAAKLLNQMVKCEMKHDYNPLTVKPKEISKPDEAVIKSLQSIPGFGDKKALQALNEFTTLESIVNASEEELAKIVGKAAAKSAFGFFNGDC